MMVCTRGFARASCCWLLSAAVLLAGAPRVALWHAHAEGDQPHSHDSFGQVQAAAYDGHHSPLSHAQPYTHDHNDDPHHRAKHDAQNSPSRSLAVTGTLPHLHVWLLGVQLNVPAPSDAPGDQLPSPETTFVATMFVALPDGLAPSQAETSLSIALSSAAAPRRDDLPQLEQTRCINQPQLLAALLCDTARFERSGVQVI
jgi:hypothetical protein